MSKKEKVIFGLATGLNFVIGLCLIIFVVPSAVPTVLNLSEKIVKLGSKWWMILEIILPSLLCLSLFLTKDARLRFFEKSIFCFCLYQNVLIFLSYSLSSSFEINSVFPISISLLVFLPISCLILCFGARLKSQPYNTFPRLWKKQTTPTNFLWTQTHFFAKNVFMSLGLVLFVCSVIFAFFKVCLIELIVFLIFILIGYLIVFKHANDLYKKYTEMKTKQDNLKTNK